MCVFPLSGCSASDRIFGDTQGDGRQIMADTEHIKKTLNLMLSQIEDEERATSEKKRAANELSRLLKEEPVFPDVDASTSALMTRPDEYYGRQMPDVIRTILEKRQKEQLGAATVSEIYGAMVQGGFQFFAKSEAYAKRGVYGILGATKDFHKLPDGRYGLASWYPAARTRSEEVEQPRKSATKKKAKKKIAKKQP